MDAGTAAEILERLKNAAPRSARLVLAQKLAAARDADRMLVMDHGRIVEDGTHEELLARGGYYARLYSRFTASPERRGA